MTDLTADQWNRYHPVGTPVTAYPALRPEDPQFEDFGAKRLITHTRTAAWTLGHGEPVVSVVGYAGGISLEHIDLRDEFCSAAFTPPSVFNGPPMPCAKKTHPTDPWHEGAPTGDPGRAWVWRDGAEGSVPAVEVAGQ